MESLSLIAMMASEARQDGTLAPSKATSRYGGSATGGSYSNMVASLAAAMKKWKVERLVSMMAFCEAPFDGTFDGTTSDGAGGSRASATTNVPEAGEGGGGEDDVKALRQAWMDGFKKRPLREHPLLLREKAAGTVVDGLANFETVAMNVN